MSRWLLNFEGQSPSHIMAVAFPLVADLVEDIALTKASVRPW